MYESTFTQAVVRTVLPGQAATTERRSRNKRRHGKPRLVFGTKMRPMLMRTSTLTPLAQMQDGDPEKSIRGEIYQQDLALACHCKVARGQELSPSQAFDVNSFSLQ